MHSYYPHIMYAIPMHMNGTGPLQALDTSFYVLRNLAMRLVMETTKRDDHGALIMLKPETWQRFIQRLIAPLDHTYSLSSSAWAMEGEIYGPKAEILVSKMVGTVATIAQSFLVGGSSG